MKSWRNLLLIAVCFVTAFFSFAASAAFPVCEAEMQNWRNPQGTNTSNYYVDEEKERIASWGEAQFRSEGEASMAEANSGRYPPETANHIKVEATYKLCVANHYAQLRAWVKGEGTRTNTAASGGSKRGGDFKVFIFEMSDWLLFTPAKTAAEAKEKVYKEIGTNTGRIPSEGELPLSKQCGTGWIALIESFWKDKTFIRTVSCGAREEKAVISAINSCNKMKGKSCLTPDDQVRISWSYFDGKNLTNKIEWKPRFVYSKEAFFGDKANACSRRVWNNESTFVKGMPDLPCNLPAGVGQ